MTYMRRNSSRGTYSVWMGGVTASIIPISFDTENHPTTIPNNKMDATRQIDA
jgi:hypothetical protein